MSTDSTPAQQRGPRRPAREDEIEPGREMREADRANGEPDATDTDGAGFDQPEKGTTGHQPLPESEPRPPAASKETP